MKIFQNIRESLNTPLKWSAAVLGTGMVILSVSALLSMSHVSKLRAHGPYIADPPEYPGADGYCPAHEFGAVFEGSEPFPFECNFGSGECGGETVTFRTVPAGQRCTYRVQVQNDEVVQTNHSPIWIDGNNCEASPTVPNCTSTIPTVTCDAGPVTIRGTEGLIYEVTDESCEAAGMTCSGGYAEEPVTTRTSGPFTLGAQGVQNATKVSFKVWSEDGGSDDVKEYFATQLPSDPSRWIATITDLADHPIGPSSNKIIAVQLLYDAQNNPVQCQNGGASFFIQPPATPTCNTHADLFRDLEPVPSRPWQAESQSGTNISGSGTIQVTNSSDTCQYEIEMASYRVYDQQDGTSNQNQPFVLTQQLHANTNAILGPGQTKTFSVSVPSCAYQLDFAVDSQPDGQATTLEPPQYGNQSRLLLLDWRINENADILCDDGDNPPEACGDGIVQAGEQCDDGNTVNGDGCSNQCTIEDDTGPVCGNGIRETGEQCDDGNTNNGDGCNSICQREITCRFDCQITANPVTGPSPLNVDFLLEVVPGSMVGECGTNQAGRWDFNGDGNYQNRGLTPSYQYIYDPDSINNNITRVSALMTVGTTVDECRTAVQVTAPTTGGGSFTLNKSANKEYPDYELEDEETVTYTITFTNDTGVLAPEVLLTDDIHTIAMNGSNGGRLKNISAEQISCVSVISSGPGSPTTWSGSLQTGGITFENMPTGTTCRVSYTAVAESDGILPADFSDFLNTARLYGPSKTTGGADTKTTTTPPINPDINQ